MIRLETLALAAALLASCAAYSRDVSPASAQHGPAPSGERYVLVHLLTDPRGASLAPEEVRAAVQGHFENMARMAQAGDLLLAGPLGEPRADPAHRGIFVFDRACAEEALELARTDPAVQAGVFELRASELRSDAPFRAMLARSAELAAAAGEDWQRVMRGFVLANSPDSRRSHEQLAGLREEGRVYFAATLEGGAGWYALDATRVEEARELLAFAGVEDAEGWSFSPWYSTRAVAELGAGAGR